MVENSDEDNNEEEGEEDREEKLRVAGDGVAGNAAGVAEAVSARLIDEAGEAAAELEEEEGAGMVSLERVTVEIVSIGDLSLTRPITHIERCV